MAAHLRVAVLADRMIGIALSYVASLDGFTRAPAASNGNVVGVGAWTEDHVMPSFAVEQTEADHFAPAVCRASSAVILRPRS